MIYTVWSPIYQATIREIESTSPQQAAADYLVRHLQAAEGEYTIDVRYALDGVTVIHRLTARVERGRLNASTS